MLIWCDLVLPSDYEMPREDNNYVGIAKDFTCRWKYENGIFEEEASKQYGVAGHFVFMDKSFLDGVPDEGEFVRWLRDTGKAFEPYPLYHTKEYGLLADYNAIARPKCRPFNRIRVEEDYIVKEAVDEQGRQLAAKEVAWYEKLKEKKFENLPVIYETQPLKMERIDGKNIYEYHFDYKQKQHILEQLVGCIKKIHALEDCPADRKSYYEAYIGKTFDRLAKVYDLVPFAHNENIIINGRKCRNILLYKEELERAVERFMPERLCLLHGDCTFSNILLREDAIPVMIDPRGYFGYTQYYGDPAYDWVKLYYSIVGNYDQFNLKRFALNIGESDVRLQIESNHWEDMEEDFFRLLDVNREQIKILHAIIWLSLTTYAWEDYDSVCGAFYNGLLLLADTEIGR